MYTRERKHFLCIRGYNHKTSKLLFRIYGLRIDRKTRQ